MCRTNLGFIGAYRGLEFVIIVIMVNSNKSTTRGAFQGIVSCSFFVWGVSIWRFASYRAAITSGMFSCPCESVMHMCLLCESLLGGRRGSNSCIALRGLLTHCR